MGFFTVRVVDEAGRPQSGIKVAVDFGILHGMAEEYTDSNGWATFDNLNGDVVCGEFYVGGESQGEHSTHDRDSYSFTI